MTLVEGLVEDMFEDIADVTLIAEDTKPILTDDANKEIPSKWRHLVAKFCTNARIYKKFMWRHLLTKLASYKVPLVMVSTHGSVVPLAMFNTKIKSTPASFFETSFNFGRL